MLSTHAYLRSHSVATCSQFGIDTHRRLAESKMEECPPGGDYTSGKDDPSKSDNPCVGWTPNPAGEQTQGESERSQLGTCLLCLIESWLTFSLVYTYSLQADTTWLSLLS